MGVELHHDTVAVLSGILTHTALPPPVRGEIRLHLGLLLVNQIGRIGAGRREIELALADLEGSDPGLIAAAALATAYSDSADLARAVTLLDAAAESLRRHGNWARAADLIPAAVDVLLAHGEPGRAAALLGEVRAGLGGRDTPAGHAAVVAGAARLAMDAGSPAPAAAGHLRAARLYSTLPRPYAVAQELALAGRCLLDTDPAKGGDLLTKALVRLEKLGATREAARYRMILRERGIAVTHRRGRRGYGARLSPREAEVARLAAAGLSNREIAEALFLSERTVEDHISRALRKTHAKSRRALVVEGG